MGSYILKARTQSTEFGGITFRPVSNDVGVPQGSKLAADLFSVYMNDMKQCVRRLFDDYTLIYVADKDNKVAERKINDELERVDKWLRVNKLKWNVDKTKCMIINNKKKTLCQYKLKSK